MLINKILSRSSYLIGALLLLSCSQYNDSNSTLCHYQQLDFIMNQTTLHTEIACSVKEREVGLMNRTSLEDNHGMLFLFNEEKTQAFWMKDTLIPLSIAFIDKNWHIVDIQEMKANDETPVYSKQPAMYVLEANKHWFSSHQINVGSKVYLSIDHMIKK